METPKIPAELLRRLRADPIRSVEHLALYAADQHGPSAAKWADGLRGSYTMDGTELAKRAKRKHASLARFGGAATGFGGIVTALPDLAALTWIQSRLIFFVAAAYDYDPTDPMRPAELLVLRNIYPDPASARAALDGVGTGVAETLTQRALDSSADRVIVKRLLQFAGKRAGRRLAGKAIPGFAVVFNAITNESETRELADKAIRFYGG